MSRSPTPPPRAPPARAGPPGPPGSRRWGATAANRLGRCSRPRRGASGRARWRRRALRCLGAGEHVSGRPEHRRPGRPHRQARIEPPGQDRGRGAYHVRGLAPGVGSHPFHFKGATPGLSRNTRAGCLDCRLSWPSAAANGALTRRRPGASSTNHPRRVRRAEGRRDHAGRLLGHRVPQATGDDGGPADRAHHPAHPARLRGAATNTCASRSSPACSCPCCRGNACSIALCGPATASGRSAWTATSWRSPVRQRGGPGRPPGPGGLLTRTAW